MRKRITGGLMHSDPNGECGPHRQKIAEKFNIVAGRSKNTGIISCWYFYTFLFEKGRKQYRAVDTDVFICSLTCLTDRYVHAVLRSVPELALQ